MEVNEYVKGDADLQSGVLDDGVLEENSAVNCKQTNKYFASEADNLETTYEYESLIEYVEEDEQVDDSIEKSNMERGIKTHTLSVRQVSLNGQSKDVYRCLECGLDFEILEDFTHAHQQMQKKYHQFRKTKKIIEPGPIEAKGREQEEAGWIVIKEEPGMQMENDVEEFYFETSESNEIVGDSATFNNHSKIAETDICIKEELNGAESAEDEDKYDGEKYFCCDCQLVFRDLESAEQHVCSALDGSDTNADALTESDIDFENNLCKFLEHQNEMLNSSNNTAKFHCPECYNEFNSLQGLKIHSRSHKPKQIISENSARDNLEPKNTTCPICNTSFGLLKNLKLHMKIHDKQQARSIEQALPAGAKTQYKDMNKFFCEICNKSFEQNLLGIHKNMHQQVTEYNCGICNRHFENKTNYEMHMQMHVDKPAKPRSKATDVTGTAKKIEGGFPCQYCGRTFQRPFEKVRHERVHTGEKPYACEVCGKTFRVSYSLTLHLRTHTDIRPYVCATCNKRFKSQPVYAHHLRTHESERAYKCETCSKAFRTSVQLSAHRNIHSKPFNCPVCNRPFASLYSVKLHMKTHEKLNRSGDVSKYSCYVCCAEYARISALRLHMKDLHLIDMDTNQSLEPNDGVNMGEENKEKRPQLERSENENEVDDEAAVLIAAATEADCAAYIDAVSAQSAVDAATGQNDELIVDNYQTEEIVADWLTK